MKDVRWQAISVGEPAVGEVERGCVEVASFLDAEDVLHQVYGVEVEVAAIAVLKNHDFGGRRLVFARGWVRIENFGNSDQWTEFEGWNVPHFLLKGLHFGVFAVLLAESAAFFEFVNTHIRRYASRNQRARIQKY